MYICGKLCLLLPIERPQMVHNLLGQITNLCLWRLGVCIHYLAQAVLRDVLHDNQIVLAPFVKLRENEAGVQVDQQLLLSPWQ